MRFIHFTDYKVVFKARISVRQNTSKRLTSDIRHLLSEVGGKEDDLLPITFAEGSVQVACCRNIILP